jgi:4-hydroxy-4-methyl-2-oxoglutarate aldolase
VHGGAERRAAITEIVDDAVGAQHGRRPAGRLAEEVLDPPGGAVLACGVRDVADLHEMRFGVWSRAVSAQGTVKATAGAVNVPVVLGGQTVHPGDVVVADDDGVVVVPRGDVESVAAAARARTEKEAASRDAFRRGELGLDRYGLRGRLGEFGIQYISFDEYQRETA